MYILPPPPTTVSPPPTTGFLYRCFTICHKAPNHGPQVRVVATDAHLVPHKIHSKPHISIPPASFSFYKICTVAVPPPKLLPPPPVQLHVPFGKIKSEFLSFAPPSTTTTYRSKFAVPFNRTRTLLSLVDILWCFLLNLHFLQSQEKALKNLFLRGSFLFVHERNIT